MNFQFRTVSRYVDVSQRSFKGTPDSIAEEAYLLADAMLRARGGTTP